MTLQELLALLQKLFQRFRKTPWFRVTYLVLLGLLVGQMYSLTLTTVACLVIILMPVTVFVVPYWLGERKIRRFAANALPVFVIAILVSAATATQFLLSQDRAIPLRSIPNFASSPKMALSNGTVTPYHADASQAFTFRVKLTTTVNGTPMAYKVYLDLTVVTGFYTFHRAGYTMNYSPGANSSGNTKNGTWYERRMNLTNAIYGYGFSVRESNSWASLPMVLSGNQQWFFTNGAPVGSGNPNDCSPTANNLAASTTAGSSATSTALTLGQSICWYTPTGTPASTSAGIWQFSLDISSSGANPQYRVQIIHCGQSGCQAGTQTVLYDANYTTFGNNVTITTPTIPAQTLAPSDRIEFRISWNVGSETSVTVSFNGPSDWTFAGPDLGPVIASGWAFYGFFVFATALSSVTLLTVTFYFVILFMWWYSARAKRVRARMLGRGPEIPKEKPPAAEPPPAEKTVKPAAYSCTNCGADVDEAAEKCPKCGAVFES